MNKDPNPLETANYLRQLVTVADLHQLKNDLLVELRGICKELSGSPSKKWLKSNEVKKLLNISNGTLQTFRSNGTLPYTKIGGVIYYEYDDIQKALSERKRK